MIQAGSVLVVEEWSRFSRRKASVSERMLHEMWELDLALGLVTQNQIITEESYNSDPGQLFGLKALQLQANEDSEAKSRHIKNVW